MSPDKVSKCVTVKDAVYFVKCFLDEIKKETVTKCFGKAGFKTDGSKTSDDEVGDDNIPNLELVELMK